MTRTEKGNVLKMYYGLAGSLDGHLEKCDDICTDIMRLLNTYIPQTVKDEYQLKGVFYSYTRSTALVIFKDHREYEYWVDAGTLIDVIDSGKLLFDTLKAVTGDPRHVYIVHEY